jgi:membrane protein required for colicin V production
VLAQAILVTNDFSASTYETIKTMIWIDLTIAGLFTFSSIVGAVKGYSQQAFSLLVAFVALIVSLHFSRELAYLLPASIKDPAAKLASAFVALFALTQLLGVAVRLVLGPLLKSTQLSLFDRLGGTILGVFRGGIWVVAAVILAGLSVLPQSPSWKKAYLLPPFQTTAIWLKEHIPSDLLETIRYR